MRSKDSASALVKGQTIFGLHHESLVRVTNGTKVQLVADSETCGGDRGKVWLNLLPQRQSFARANENVTPAVLSAWIIANIDIQSCGRAITAISAGEVAPIFVGNNLAHNEETNIVLIGRSLPSGHTHGIEVTERPTQHEAT